MTMLSAIYYLLILNDSNFIKAEYTITKDPEFLQNPRLIIVFVIYVII